MDLVKLGLSSHLPVDLIEGYETCIWTERYWDAGEVQIITGDVQKFLNQVPIGCLLSHRETDEVMIVEDILIKTDNAHEGDGIVKLTITGQSFEAFLRHRVAAVDLDTLPNPWQLTDDNSGMVARWIINRALEGGTISPHDVVPLVDTIQDPAVTTEDEGEPVEYDIQLSQTYERVLEILKTVGLGLRTQRPLYSGGPLNVQVYRGKDRRASQSVNTPVVLRSDLGHFTEMSYLISERDYKNVAYVYSPIGSREVLRWSLDPDTSGLDRKVLYVDASDLTEVSPGNTAYNLLLKRGRQAMMEHNRTFIFEGKVSPEIPYKYKVDYDLGDQITILGEYGLQTDMIVTEYILSEGPDGEVGYPTLSPPPKPEDV